VRLIGLALQQRCRHEQDYLLSRWDRWWLTAKVIAAIVLRLDADRHAVQYLSGCVTVANFDWRRTFDGEYSGAAGSVLRVARYGLGYDVVSDGWP
jgi:hypothetical protein